MDPSSFHHRKSKLSTGRTYHFVDQLPKKYNPRRNPTILCIHGFPDCWYGYRYQIRPWTHKGFRVVVPDMLGYGDTDRPEHPSEYSTKKLCADLAALLDHLGVQRAIVIGHDWGAFTAGRFALWHPDRLLALAILSVPYTPPTVEYMSIQRVAKIAPNLAYQAYFDSERSSQDIDSNLTPFLRLIFRKSNGADININDVIKGPENLAKLKVSDTDLILKPKDFKYYHKVLSKGMKQPLNYYRTSLYRFEEEKAASLPSHLREDLPVLFIWGTKDTTCTASVISKSHKFVSRLQVVALEDFGHWILIEDKARDQVTKTTLEWLEGLMVKPPKAML
ncbi:hypothetical protein D9758_004882 [Tetrapyrgos nigripes]|uniref:AB hydrolase-1 domain-containing protein n=1 Tax=Tetrapyrgos nigripes TaxID=182062 RepID=A0A8H5G5Z8_9AGAR|nr:hypothetical protein D9758_004882 [Tetrapyrgos nigripes]